MLKKTLAVTGVAIVLSIFSTQSRAQPTERITSQFAEDVILHVVLHELGHALIREFDLPILGNEETMADAFATYYVTRYFPNRSEDVITARVTSLMIEAGEVSRAEWPVTGEHNNDARRAHQIASLAVAADPEKFDALARQIGMSDSQINQAQEYGSEIHRSWRRILQPILMPEGMQSRETRIRFDPGGDLLAEFRSRPVVGEIESALQRFDWHSQVTVFFIQGDGGAGWSRSERRITVYTEYIRRFIKQGSEQ